MSEPPPDSDSDAERDVRVRVAPDRDRPSAWTYLLRCADGSLYAGWTNDLERRLAAHTVGTASRYTRSRRPVVLALALPQRDRSAAMREEARIKRLTRPQKLALIAAEGPPPPA